MKYILNLFNILEKFYDKSFYDNNKKIELVTDTTKKVYEVFSVYVETIDFSYMNLDFDNDDEYLTHINKLKNRSIYDEEIELTSNDEILILQTCSSLKKYRNYDNLEISFNDNLNIIIGDNAQGKTNLLESIYVLGVTRSFLSGNDRNLIKFENKASLIKGEVITNDGKFNLEVLINENGKVVKVNNKEIKKLSDYISLLNVIVFNSDSIRIFKDSPNSRRKYFNIEISQINKKYLKLLSDYNTILRQRNEFLKVININKEKDMMYLSILNEKYAFLSLEIYNYRKKFIDDINMYLGNSFKYIAGYDNLVIKYASNFSNFDNKTFLEKLNDNLNRDIQYKMTLIGPNRDDFYFLLGDKNLSLYGSQGQIRSAVLALKLSEVKLFNNITGDTPILLLDDMFSELDINKRNNILRNLSNDVQTIITTTDIENISKDIRKKANVYKIDNGKIISREII